MIVPRVGSHLPFDSFLVMMVEYSADAPSNQLLILFVWWMVECCQRLRIVE
jgi:hypothetical protein